MTKTQWWWWWWWLSKPAAWRDPPSCPRPHTCHRPCRQPDNIITSNYLDISTITITTYKDGPHVQSHPDLLHLRPSVGEEGSRHYQCPGQIWLAYDHFFGNIKTMIPFKQMPSISKLTGPISKPCLPYLQRGQSWAASHSLLGVL